MVVKELINGSDFKAGCRLLQQMARGSVHNRVKEIMEKLIPGSGATIRELTDTHGEEEFWMFFACEIDGTIDSMDRLQTAFEGIKIRLNRSQMSRFGKLQPAIQGLVWHAIEESDKVAALTLDVTHLQETNRVLKEQLANVMQSTTEDDAADGINAFVGGRVSDPIPMDDGHTNQEKDRMIQEQQETMDKMEHELQQKNDANNAVTEELNKALALVAAFQKKSRQSLGTLEGAPSVHGGAKMANQPEGGGAAMAKTDD